MDAMKKFGDWYHGNNEKEKEPPRSGIRRIGYVLWNYTGGLVLVNLAFLLCCIPVITIPAAFTALNRYLIQMFRTGYGFSFADYVKEFKGSFFKSIPYGILTGILGFYGYYLLSLAGNFEGTAHSGILTGAGLGVVIVAVLLGGYLFLMAAMLDLPGKYILKNACILMFVEWKSSVILAVSVLAYWALLLGCAPYSFLFLLFFGGALQQLIVCAALNPAISRRIIEPYEKQKNMV